MKKYLLLLLSILSFAASAQTVPTLPTGAKPYGNQLYIVPSTGLIYGGNAGYQYRVLGTKKYVDSIMALGYRKTQVDSILTNGYFNKAQTNNQIDTILNGVKTTNLARVFFVGDSRTVGFNCTGTPYSYVDQLSLGSEYTLIKVASGGATVTDQQNYNVEWLQKSSFSGVDPNIGRYTPVNIAVLIAGYNDMSVRDVSYIVVERAVKAWVQARKKAGFRVIVATEQSCTDAFGGDTRRLEYNDWLRKNWAAIGADDIVDLANNPLYGGTNAYQNTTYFCDGVHWTNALTNIVASMVQPVIQRVALRTNVFAGQNFTVTGYPAESTVQTKPMLTLGRSFLYGVSNANTASFNLGRYATNGSGLSKTRLDLALGGDSETGYSTSDIKQTWTSLGTGFGGNVNPQYDIDNNGSARIQENLILRSFNTRFTSDGVSLYTIHGGNFYLNTANTAFAATDGTINGTNFNLSALNTAPSSATDTGTTGEIRVTAGFIYVCTATNTWVRTPLSTW